MEDKNILICYEGQPCRKCSTPVNRRTHKLNWKPRAHQPYYFEWWFKCANPKCQTIYLVEEAKRWLVQPPNLVDIEFRDRLTREP